MAELNKIPKYTYQLYAFGITVLYILFYGYQFNTGDQSEHLPQVYRMLNPSLYPNDFFLNHFDQTFTVRTYWIYLVFGVSKVIGVEWACFSLYFGSIYFTILAWMFITRHLTESKFASIIASLLFLFAFNNFTVGGNTLLGQIFVGSTMAEAIASWGIYFWLNNKKQRGAIFIGISCLFQVLVGLQLFVLLSLLHFLTEKNIKSYSRYLIYLGYFLLVASPMLFPLIYRQSFHTQKAADLSVFYETLFIQRAPWHYIPSLFPMKDYFKLLALSIVGFISLKFQRPNARLFPIKTLSLLIIGGCIAYYIVVEPMDKLSFGKFQWFKTTVWLSILMSVAISGALANIPYRYMISYVNQYRLLGLIGVFSLMGLIAIVNSNKYIPPSTTNDYHIGNYYHSPLELMHEWIQKNTAVNALFLIPPNDESFSCEAQRPTPVNYKAVVHEPFYFVAWRKAMSTYYHVDFDHLTAQPLQQQATNAFYQYQPDSSFDIQYVLYDESKLGFKINTTSIVHREQNWIVVAVK